MKRVFQRRIRHQADGVNVAADVGAVVSTNTGTGAARTGTAARQRLRVVQRGGENRVSRERRR